MKLDQEIRSRGIIGYAYGVFAGVMSALLLAFSLAHAGTFLVLGAYLATVPLFMAAMGAGLSVGFLACVTGLAGLLGAKLTGFGLFYLIADAIPAFLLSYVALHKSERGSVESGLLTVLTVYPCLIFLGIYAMTMDHPGGLLAITVDAFNSAEGPIKQMMTDRGLEVTPEVAAKIHQYFEICARISPALAMGAWMLSTLIAMMAAQLVLLLPKWNLRPAFSLTNLKVPTGVIFAAAITGLMAAFAPAPYEYIGLNLVILLAIPFFFTGLAVVHAYAATTRLPLLVLAVFYIVIGRFVHLALLVALVGALDQWVDFRKRFAEQNLTKGDER